MALVQMHWQPTDRQLRQFAVSCLVALPVLSWLGSGGNPAILGGAAAIGAAITALGWFRPRWLVPLFIGLSLAVLPIGWLISELLLLLLFYGLFWPIGFMRRRLLGDPLQRRADREAASYWQAKAQPADPASYFRQF